MSRRAVLIVAAAAVAAALVGISYKSRGLAYVLAVTTTGGGPSLTAIREWVLGWGTLAPLAYVAAVTVEVLVAPIPGALLYAPAGAIFGGGWGGTLSLAGNVAGATIACALARLCGARVSAKLGVSALAPVAERVRRRGIWMVALLRVNPLTSSDLVSYAAGLVGVPVWQVTLGTFIGMAPLCYAQAYLAKELFALLPGSGVLLLACGVAYVALVALVMVQGARTTSMSRR